MCEYAIPQGFSNYRGFRNGAVESRKSGYWKPMRPAVTYQGYRAVGFVGDDGRRVTWRLNRLLANCFLPNPNNLPLVRHLNDQKLDDRLENLAWGSPRDNSADASRNGLLNGPGAYKTPTGPAHPGAKLTGEQIVSVFLHRDNKLADVAAMYGVTKSYVSMVRKGKACAAYVRSVIGDEEFARLSSLLSNALYLARRKQQRKERERA